MTIINTTLGYLEKEDCYLLLHRVKKKQDINRGKWIGIGGKLESGETVLDCMIRECKEETGLEWQDPTLRGMITFQSSDNNGPWTEELMFLYTGSCFSGTLKECKEGELAWIPKKDLFSLPMWPGDRIFLKLLEKDIPLFYLLLVYEDGKLQKAVLNGIPQDIETDNTL